ncbi:unnamed protein product [Rhizophagus irregularis]|nr:unnamed protein product [Rhizophagus irregularis]
MFTMFRQYEELWRKILEAKVLDEKLLKVKYFGCKLTPFFVQNFQGYEENLGDDLVKDMEITELALCPECNNSLFSDSLKALTLLECGYVYHRLNFALHICRGIAYLNALGINNKFITMV